MLYQSAAKAHLAEFPSTPDVCRLPGRPILPITPVSGRVKPAGFGAVESGSYEGGFWRVFGRGLQGSAGRADADAQPLGDDLPRGAGRTQGGDAQPNS
jgi:hypothetical protein